MILNKKGLSDVITIVLIILLVLVAISVIWIFAEPSLRNMAANENMTTNINCSNQSIIDGVVLTSTNSSGATNTFYLQNQTYPIIIDSSRFNGTIEIQLNMTIKKVCQ